MRKKYQQLQCKRLEKRRPGGQARRIMAQASRVGWLLQTYSSLNFRFSDRQEKRGDYEIKISIQTFRRKANFFSTIKFSEQGLTRIFLLKVKQKMLKTH